MKIIISGGGTGGHIYPALTLINKIKQNVHDCEFLYIGTDCGMESDIVPKAGIAFKTIDVQGFRRALTVKNIKIMLKSFNSIFKSYQIIKEFKPDVVVGTGGYVCGPVLLAAALMKVPTLIQEQNVIPGITNKILGKFVDAVAVGYQEAKQYFSAKKVFFTGNPIRDEIMTAQKDVALKELGLKEDKFTVVISGGSRGARSINFAMLGVHKYFANNKKIQLLHITGKGDYNTIVDKLKIDLKLDEIDNQLIDLLAKRMRVSREIGQYKKEHNMTVLQAQRYNEILSKRGVQGSLCGMSSEFTTNIFEHIHEESVRQQMEIINK